MSRRISTGPDPPPLFVIHLFIGMGDSVVGCAHGLRTRDAGDSQAKRPHHTRVGCRHKTEADMGPTRGRYYPPLAASATDNPPAVAEMTVAGRAIPAVTSRIRHGGPGSTRSRKRVRVLSLRGVRP